MPERLVTKIGQKGLPEKVARGDGQVALPEKITQKDLKKGLAIKATREERINPFRVRGCFKLLRNPILRSTITKSGAKRPKIGKKETKACR